MTTLTELFIDKLVLLVDMDKSDAEGLASILLDETREHIDRLHGYYPNYRGLGYQYAFGLPLNNAGNTECKIYLKSYRTNTSNIRIEYNPSKLDDNSSAFLWNKLSSWFINEHYTHLQNAIVSRIDIAIDIHPVSLETIWVTAPRFRISELKNNIHGKLETYILGSYESDNQIKLYDKEVEQRRKNKHIPNANKVRLEYRTSFNKCISELPELENVLTQIELIHAIDPSELPLHDYKKMHFLDSVRFRGPHAALSLINPSRKKREMRMCLKKNASTDWWEPERIWQDFDEALARLNIPSDVMEIN